MNKDLPKSINIKATSKINNPSVLKQVIKPKKTQKKRKLIFYSSLSLFAIAAIYGSYSWLNRGAVFIGKITDAKTGKPLFNASIQIDQGDLIQNNNDNGAFIINGLKSGEHTLTISRNGFEKYSNTFSIKSGQELIRDFPLSYKSAESSFKGDYLLVANKGSSNLSLINAETNNLVRNISVSSSPVSIITVPEQNKAYTVNSSDSSVSVIDLISMEKIKDIKLKSNSSPKKIVYSSGSDNIYVLNGSIKEISIINALNDNLVRNIELENFATDLFVSSSGSLLLLDSSGIIKVINSNGAEINKINTGISSSKYYYSNYSNTFYFIQSDKVISYNLFSNQKQIYNIAFNPSVIAVNEYSTEMYLASYDSFAAYSLPQGNTLVSGLKTGGSKADTIYYNQDLNRVFISNSLSNNLSVFNPASLSFSDNMPGLGSEPGAMAFVHLD